MSKGISKSEQDAPRRLTGKGADAAPENMDERWERNRWCGFFYDHDFERERNELILADDCTLGIECLEQECYYARPDHEPGKWSFLNWPDIALPASEREWREPVPAYYGAGTHSLVASEIDETDVVLGMEERIKALLKAVRRKSAGKKVVMLKYPCTQLIMGVDLDSMGRRFQKAAKCPVLGVDRKSREELSIFEDWFKIIRNRPDHPAVNADPLAVNLFDFPRRYRKEELLPFLEEIGLKPNACLFPAVEVSAVQRLELAALCVFREHSFWEPTMSKLLAGSQQRMIEVPAPYGIKASRECFRQIAAAAGREAAFAKAWEKRWKEFRRPWEEMTRRARGYRLGFVIGGDALHKLGRTSWWPGGSLLDIIGLLREMGFGVDVLLHYPGDRTAIAHALRMLAGLPTRIFRSPEELQKCLREGKFRAVYSDIFFDWRLTISGKAMFSSRNFEMGVGGALRSLESLLAVCRLPFYERYADSFSRMAGRDRV